MDFFPTFAWVLFFGNPKRSLFTVDSWMPKETMSLINSLSSHYSNLEVVFDKATRCPGHNPYLRSPCRVIAVDSRLSASPLVQVFFFSSVGLSVRWT